MRKKIFAAVIGILVLLILVFVMQAQKDNTVAEKINTLEAAQRIAKEFNISLEANQHGGFDWKYIDAASDDRTNNTYYLDLDSDEEGELDFLEAHISSGRLREEEDFHAEAEDFLLSIIPVIFTNEGNIEFAEDFVKKNLPDYADDELTDIYEEAVAGNYKLELWITKSGDYYSRFALNVIKNG